MKLKFKGGRREAVHDPKTGKVTEREQLTQVFEETEYHWPTVGSVLPVADNIGAWLLGKHPKHLERVAEERLPEAVSAPRRLVAVKPEEHKEQDPS